MTSMGKKDMTCGEVKEMYKKAGCCKNPSKVFDGMRRLQAKTGNDDNAALLMQVAAALEQAKKKSPMEAQRLASRITNAVKNFDSNGKILSSPHKPSIPRTNAMSHIKKPKLPQGG